MQAAYAICSVEDSFNPGEGAKRALARLNSQSRRGARNSKMELHDDSHFVSPPMVADEYSNLALGFDYIAEETENGHGVDEVTAFAWAVAVHAALTMRGGTPENKETLLNTLWAYPREKHEAA
jgi:hypothetical protein